MEIKELLESIAASKKNIDHASRLLKRIDLLRGDLSNNFLLLKSNLDNLKKLSDVSASEDPLFKNIIVWAENFSKQLDFDQERLKDQFGIILERELIHQGYELKGNYPKFTAGFFTIVTNHRKWFTKILYGPNQELLDTCLFSPSLVATRIKVAREAIGSKVSENSFLDLLNKTYAILVRGKPREPVPINEILLELRKTMNPDMQSNSSRSKNTVYSRADFSYDLFRTRALVDYPELVVATRLYTKKRSDFLWVPMDETGRGAFYSHLKFEEKWHE